MKAFKHCSAIICFTTIYAKKKKKRLNIKQIIYIFAAEKNILFNEKNTTVSPLLFHILHPASP